MSRRQDQNTAPNRNTHIDFRLEVNNLASLWNAQVEAYIMSSTRLGLSVPQITTDLCRNGYAASTAEVMGCLSRQPAPIMSRRVAELGFGLVRWDFRAEAFTLAAHQIGQTPVQILAGLNRAGYGATAQDVGASLSRQGGAPGVVLDGERKKPSACYCKDRVDQS